MTPFVRAPRPRREIQVIAYDPRWPGAYERLAAQVRSALGDRVLGIEHVGSTSVPGLAAKPVIDIDLIVRDPADEDAWVSDLEAAGFELVIREPWWQEHRMLATENPACNLHVFGPEAAEPVRMRMFRDWLRSHPEDRALYRDAKLAAAAASNAAGEHTQQYNARKQSVVREIYHHIFCAAGFR